MVQGYLRAAKVFPAAHPERADCDQIMRSIYRYALANVSAQRPDDSNKLAVGASPALPLASGLLLTPLR